MLTKCGAILTEIIIDVLTEPIAQVPTVYEVALPTTTVEALVIFVIIAT